MPFLFCPDIQFFKNVGYETKRIFRKIREVG